MARDNGMPRTAKCYVALVWAAGFLTAVVTLAQAEWRSEHVFELTAYVLMAVLSSRLKVRLPGVRGTLSVNFIFVLLGVVELQKVDALIISCVATLAQCFLAAEVRPRLVQVVFNLGNAAVCAVLCDIVYHAAFLHRMDSSLPVLLFCASITYFLVNTLVVSQIIALTERKKTRIVWQDNFFWTGPQYLFGAALVGIIHLCNSRFGWEYSVLAFPGIYLLDRSYRVYLRRLQEEKQHVKDHEEAYAQLAAAQQRLMTLSRQAGMAEVATGVLHNVGNVLNSVNVSATLVAERVRESPIAKLALLARMLEEHSSRLPDFLCSDPKGKSVVPYLTRLAACLTEEREGALRELQLLTGHIEHIKQIVATQQSYGKVSGLIENVSLESLVEDAIRIVRPGLDRRGIRIELGRGDGISVAVDKHMIFQILLNLLRNAEEAIDAQGQAEKLIRVRINRYGEDRVRLEVRDNGVGVAPENLTRIFQHGFTTKAGGHGFGLHSGALAAQQLGGTLRAESDGPGLGATFTLELPVAAANLSPSAGQQQDGTDEAHAEPTEPKNATGPACKIPSGERYLDRGGIQPFPLPSTPGA